MTKFTTLPYMGQHPEAEATVARHVESKEINMSALHDYELKQAEAAVNDLSDPYLVLTRKVTHLANLLGCSEAEAERILFARIGT